MWSKIKTKNERGFTIPELLMVVAIMAVIVPALFAAFHTIMKVPVEGNAALATSHDVNYAAEWITRDANIAYHFSDEIYDPQTGNSGYRATFFWNYDTDPLSPTYFLPTYVVSYRYDSNSLQLMREGIEFTYDAALEPTPTIKSERIIMSRIEKDVSGNPLHAKFDWSDDPGLDLISAHLEATEDAGLRLISSEEKKIYARLMGRPWQMWCPYALAGLGLYEAKFEACKGVVEGNFICNGPITISSNPTKATTINGFIHSNFPWQDGDDLIPDQTDTTKSIDFAGQGTKIYGLASAYGVIDGDNHATFDPSGSGGSVVNYADGGDYPTDGNPVQYAPYKPFLIPTLEWFRPPQEVCRGFPLIEGPAGGTGTIDLQWLLDEEYATQSTNEDGKTVFTLTPGVYYTDGTVSFDTPLTNNAIIDGTRGVTLVGFKIILKGNSDTEFRLNALDPRGFLCWCTGTDINLDIDITANKSILWGVIFAPYGEASIEGTGSGDPLETGPIIAWKLNAKNVALVVRW